ncbi:replication initiation protein [Cellulophaga sp. BC115SP]|jgi:plasmid replication initiation protein|uniref:replication initiation protein n=1 Tax=Cellulophaga sp. BC115SP TaxID=2683263 RepID=UPI00141297D5|nr:replication initiation protein [Cellulophaga sp. BC115SP]NBB31955.1 RepB family plasmid replication initiator protein [Cellulophaga sp. BC115SP]
MEPYKFLQSNAITKARYDYSVTEKRLIYHALMEVEKIVKNGVTEEFFSRELDLFIPEALLSKFDKSDNRFRDYRKAVISLRKKDFSIDLPDDGWIETGFLTRGKYHKNKGLEISISRDVLPYLYELSKQYSILEATVLMTLQSKFSQRFYEFCCQWRSVGKFEFTPEKLKEILLLKLQIGSLKEKVIETAQAELKMMYEQGISDLFFTYTEERGGRGRGGSVKKWLFTIHTKKKEKEKEKAQNTDLIFVFNFLSNIFNNSTTVDKAIEALANHENLKDFANRIDKLSSSPRWSTINNKAGYIRSILQNEYGMDEDDD